MNKEDYRVVLEDLPCSIRGFTKMDNDGDYTIILNSRMSLETQRRTYLHEIEHIEKDDIHSPLTADQIEAVRHE